MDMIINIIYKSCYYAPHQQNTLILIMETIVRTLDIPKNHQIKFTLPRSIPTGKAKVVLVIHPTLEVSPISKDEALFKLSGTLKNSLNFNGDSVMLQRKMREEWNG